MRSIGARKRVFIVSCFVLLFIFGGKLSNQIVFASEGDPWLSSGEGLQIGQRIVSPNGAYEAIQQEDGNLVVYNITSEGLIPIWASMSIGQGYESYLLNGQIIVSPDGRFQAIQQEDGKLVVNLYISNVLYKEWESDSSRAGFGNYATTVQPDGNLVIYRYGIAEWNTETCGAPGNSFILKMQNDGNLVLYNGDGMWIWCTHEGKNSDIFGPQPTTVKLISWDLVDSGKHLDYDGNSVYMDIVESGIALWNNYKSGVIRKDTWYNTNDVTITDVSDEISVYAATTYSNGVIKINAQSMDRLDNDKRINVVTHELGHALGLGHNTYMDIMYYRLTGRTELSENDKASYDAAYNNYK